MARPRADRDLAGRAHRQEAQLALLAILCAAAAVYVAAFGLLPAAGLLTK